VLSKRKRNSGFSLSELIVALLFLLFIVSGLAVGMRDYLKRQKSLELHTLGRQILEVEKGYLINLPIDSFASLRRDHRGVCDLNGTCSFEVDCFTSPMSYDGTNCHPPFRCVACLKGKQIVYDDCAGTPYTFNLSYTLAEVNLPSPEDPTQILSQTPIGLGICMKVEFKDPATNRAHSYQALILKMDGR